MALRGFPVWRFVRLRRAPRDAMTTLVPLALEVWELQAARGTPFVQRPVPVPHPSSAAATTTGGWGCAPRGGRSTSPPSSNRARLHGQRHDRWLRRNCEGGGDHHQPWLLADQHELIKQSYDPGA